MWRTKTVWFGRVSCRIEISTAFEFRRINNKRKLYTEESEKKMYFNFYDVKKNQTIYKKYNL